MKSSINLQKAKIIINLPDFKRDDLLEIALTEPSDLDVIYCHDRQERDKREKIYRKLAFLGDALLDAILADYLFNFNNNLNKKELDDFRQKILSKDSLTKFAIKLRLPEFSSSHHKKNRLSPEEQPRLWAEMFEAIIGVIFLDRKRDFLQLSQWLTENFLRPYIEDEDYSGYESDYSEYDEIYEDGIETSSGNIYDF